MLKVFELKSKDQDTVYDAILFQCKVKVCSDAACKTKYDAVSFLFSL